MKTPATMAVLQDNLTELDDCSLVDLAVVLGF
jgi:hypothetical protein